jgi:hypothetical protein
LNPYAPPAGREEPGRGARFPGELVSWAFLGVTALMEGVALYALVAPNPAGPAQAMEVLLVARFVVMLAWLYGAWRSIPPAFRSGRSPASAVLVLFVPCFNVVWAFVVATLVCLRINQALERSRSEVRAPAWLGAAATLGSLWWFLPRYFELVVPAFVWRVAFTANNVGWVAYVLLVDRARRELQRHPPAEASLVEMPSA